MSSFTQQWQELKRSKPGQRFKDRYARHKQSRESGDVGKKFVRITLALGLLAVGVVLVFIPGPAILFFFLGGGLLASDSLPVARFLDWFEVHLRRFGRALRRQWAGISLWLKVLLATLVFSGGMACAYAAYRFISH